MTTARTTRYGHGTSHPPRWTQVVVAPLTRRGKYYKNDNGVVQLLPPNELTTSVLLDPPQIAFWTNEDIPGAAADEPAMTSLAVEFAA